jgi:hypothetical protein
MEQRMSHSFRVTEMGDIHIDDAGQFAGLSFTSLRDGEVKLGMHPDMANELAQLILKALAQATSDGRLPMRNLTIQQGGIHGEVTPSGISLRFDLPERGPRLAADLSIPDALQLLSLVSDLIEQHGRQAPKPN